jgi:hypothetical protein
MELVWMVTAFAVIVMILISLLTRLTARAKRREICARLGLPTNARLTPEQAQAFRAFEDTDMKLKKNFPNLSDRQRHVIARDILRDRGALPQRRRQAT